MTDTAELFLGIIAFSVMVMALIQIGAIYAGIRLARRVDQLAVQMDQEIKPLIANLTALSSEAARAASLAAKQAERLDRVFGELVQRVDTTLAAAEEFVTGPARQGMAIMLRLNRVIDKGIAVAVVGYTDALVATLFAQNGVPALDAEYDAGEVERQLDGIEQELHAIVKQQAP